MVKLNFKRILYLLKSDIIKVYYNIYNISEIMRFNLNTLICSSIISLGVINALNNGVGLTPAMGWSTKLKYGCNVNYDVVTQTAQKIKDLGLSNLGYVYVNVDDCWLMKDRND